MRLHIQRRFAVAALALFVSLAGASAAAAAPQVIDRIVATVNGQVILQSDLDEALCYEALLSGRPLSGFLEEDRRTVLDRLIDQELLREKYPEGAMDDGWNGLLAKYHITQKDLFSHVRQQIDVMRLVDARLRPAVQIDSKSIEAYYRDQFVPKLKESGAGEVPLGEVSNKIRELLTQEKVSEMLVSWLQTLRSEGDVHIPGVTPSSTDSGVQAR
jgi:peptidyl-prolyl cis-trans isomerase SurA